MSMCCCSCSFIAHRYPCSRWKKVQAPKQWFFEALVSLFFLSAIETVCSFLPLSFRTLKSSGDDQTATMWIYVYRRFWKWRFFVLMCRASHWRLLSNLLCHIFGQFAFLKLLLYALRFSGFRQLFLAKTLFCAQKMKPKPKIQSHVAVYLTHSCSQHGICLSRLKEFLLACCTFFGRF